MELKKAMKKLKFWPRMKKRKKHYHHLLPSPPPSSPPRPFSQPPPPPPSRPPPPPPCNYHYEPLPPSAPPLPPWLEYHMQIQETMVFASEGSTSSSLVDHDASNKTLLSKTQEIDSGYDMIVKHVEEGPVLKRLERRGEVLGGFGCVVSFGAHLVRCVFPCFSVRDEMGEKVGLLNKER